MTERRGYTLVELAVAAFATMLMVVAMTRWTLDVAAFTQSTLSGRDDGASDAAYRLLDADLAAAVFCLPGGASARVSLMDADMLVLPAVRVPGEFGDVFERVEWRLQQSGDGLLLQRAALPVLPPGGSGAATPCWEAAAPAQGDWGTLVHGLSEGSELRFLALPDPLPVVCVGEWSSASCRPQVMELVLHRDGEEFFRRSLLMPSAR